MDMSLGELQEIAKDREAWHVQFMGLQRVRHDLATEEQAQQQTLKETPEIIKQTLGGSEGQRSLVCCTQSMGLQRVRHN